MIGTAKDAVNIAFFIVVGTVTVLSYLHARRTLFAPIRTETFKLQLKAFEDVLLFFQNKAEHDFLEMFDFPRILDLNAARMADAYVITFFEGEISIDGKTRAAAVGELVSEAHAQKYFEIIGPHDPELEVARSDGKTATVEERTARWREYEHAFVGYTREYVNQTKELDRLAASPLLPARLREQIGGFGAFVHHDLVSVGEIVTECAKQMPDHFRTAQDMTGFTPAWIWNRFNSERTNYDPRATEILAFINEYLNVEKLTG